MEAICRNCHQTRRLQRSHAIPNSLFKTLARGSAGQFIELNDGPSKAKFSQDSGRDFLLCSECEHLFGRIFDGPLVEEIRLIRAAFKATGSTVNSDLRSMKSSIAAIIWRALLSNSYLYRGFKAPIESIEKVVSEIWCTDEKSRMFSYSLQPIFDPTPLREGGFGPDAIESFIMTPKLWGVRHGFHRRVQSGWGAIFVMGGVAVTMLQPCLSPYKEREKSFLLSTGRASRLRPVSIWSIPYVKEFLTYAVQKERHESVKGSS